MAPPAPFVLPQVDLAASPDQATELRQLIAENAGTRFDLEHGPLWRATLATLGPDDNALVVTMHHAVTDGWSTGVLARELGALYEAYAAGEPSPLDPLAIRYGDYAVWQRAWLAGGELERQVAYWREALDALAPLDLPADRPRPPAGRPRQARR